MTRESSLVAWNRMPIMVSAGFGSAYISSVSVPLSRSETVLNRTAAAFEPSTDSEYSERYSAAVLSFRQQAAASIPQTIARRIFFMSVILCEIGVVVGGVLREGEDP